MTRRSTPARDQIAELLRKATALAERGRRDLDALELTILGSGEETTHVYARAGVGASLLAILDGLPRVPVDV